MWNTKKVFRNHLFCLCRERKSDAQLSRISKLTPQQGLVKFLFTLDCPNPPSFLFCDVEANKPSLRDLISRPIRIFR